MRAANDMLPSTRNSCFSYQSINSAVSSFQIRKRKLFFSKGKRVKRVISWKGKDLVLLFSDVMNICKFMSAIESSADFFPLIEKGCKTAQEKRFRSTSTVTLQRTCQKGTGPKAEKGKLNHVGEQRQRWDFQIPEFPCLGLWSLGWHRSDTQYWSYENCAPGLLVPPQLKIVSI